MKITKQQLIQIIKEEIEFSQHHEKSSDQVFSDYDESEGLAKELRLKNVYNDLSEIREIPELTPNQKKKIDTAMNRILVMAEKIKSKSVYPDQT